MMILVGYHHGLRSSEVVAIKSNDVADGYLTVARLKDSLKTTQPLVGDPEPLLDERSALFDWMRGIGNNQRLFKISAGQFWRIFRRHCETAGIPAHKRHPHVLKHSLALHLLEIVPINVVQQALGHKNLSSTGAYLKMTDVEAWAAIAKARKG